jgi:hypothetical protein
MKKLLQFAAFLALAVPMAWGIQIEGVTPSGSIKTVKVTNDGRFEVSGATVTQTVNITGDEYVRNSTGTALLVNSTTTLTVGPSNTAIFVVKSTSTLGVFYAVTALTANIRSVIYPADGARNQGAFCNVSSALGDGPVQVNIGDGSVSNQGGASPGFPLADGTCYSPDNPLSFRGAISGISTATAHTAYIYHK